MIHIDKYYVWAYYNIKWDIPLDIMEVRIMTAVKDYTVHIDSKKRITLRGAIYQYYNVKEYDNGFILLEPRELVVPAEISANTLKMMDNAVKNITVGNVSEAIDLSEF